ncbi:MAG: hypothetical protein H0T72_01185 [Chloroflexia bacterium]|jgi:tellurite resistance protein|nr:hypothetical protein [Chloroflexia bacterium]
MSSDVDDTVRAFEKERRWRAAERALTALRQDPDEWRDYLAEAAAWDVTSADGLDELPYDHRPEDLIPSLRQDPR